MTKSRGLVPHPRRGELAAFIETAVAHTGSECLLWPFQRNDAGYGIVDFRSRGGIRTRAHRVVCERVHGAQPMGRPEVAHGCGNRACVAPRHLRWDTHIGNHADRHAHGTANHGKQPRGEAQGLSKLTNDQAQAIKAQPNRRRAELAAEFGVSVATIKDIRRGKSWAWL